MYAEPKCSNVVKLYQVTYLVGNEKLSLTEESMGRVVKELSVPLGLEKHEWLEGREFISFIYGLC